MKDEQLKASKVYQENIMQEKDHFLRIKEFEDECDRNDELR